MKINSFLSGAKPQNRIINFDKFTKKRGEVRTVGKSAGPAAYKIANVIRSLLRDVGVPEEELPTNDIIFGMRGIIE